MAVFGGLVLTNSGRNLLAKNSLGKILKFKRIALGDGELGPSESMITLTKLKNELLSQDIIGLKIIQDSIVQITFQLTNTKLQEGFYWRELGVIAEDPDTQEEVLYCYGNARENGEYISAGGEADILEKYVNIDIIVSSSENVTAVIDESMVFVTKKDIENLKKTQVIVSEEEPQEECIWFKVVSSKEPSNDIAEILLELADTYDENSTYQLETIVNMTDNEDDENKIIEREE